MTQLTQTFIHVGKQLFSFIVRKLNVPTFTHCYWLPSEFKQTSSWCFQKPRQSFEP